MRRTTLRAREPLGRLSDPFVGKTNDAVLFMYLNQVHNAFRTATPPLAT